MVGESSVGNTVKKPVGIIVAPMVEGENDVLVGLLTC